MNARARGFTTIELLVTVAVIGVLGAVAFPSMRDFVDRQRLIGQVRAVSNLAQLARSEAIKHSASGAAELKSVSMTVSPVGSWFVGLANGTTACSGATCVVNQGGNSVSHTVTASDCSGCTMISPASQQVITFDLRGLVSGGTDQAITLRSPMGKQLSLSISRLGRISLCTPAGSLQGYTSC